MKSIRTNPRNHGAEGDERIRTAVCRYSDFSRYESTPPVCRGCDGDGWYVGHEDECHETGDCQCSGVQIPCEMCGGSGAVS